MIKKVKLYPFFLLECSFGYKSNLFKHIIQIFGYIFFNKTLIGNTTFHNTDINQQHYIPHQGIDDGRNGNDVIIEYKRR